MVAFGDVLSSKIHLLIMKLFKQNFLLIAYYNLPALTHV